MHRSSTFFYCKIVKTDKLLVYIDYNHNGDFISVYDNTYLTENANVYYDFVDGIKILTVNNIIYLIDTQENILTTSKYNYAFEYHKSWTDMVIKYSIKMCRKNKILRFL